MANDFELCRRLNYDIVRVTYAILTVETPLSEEWLLKRIVHLFDGKEKVTSAVHDRFDGLMWTCERMGIIRHNGFLYLENREIPMLRIPSSGMTPREIKYIAVEELAKGMKEILRQNVTAEKTGLFKLLANQLGFSHMGDSIASRLERALKMLSKEIRINGETISLIKT